MKIIAVIPVRYTDNNFVCEVSHQEMGQLLGHSYAPGHIRQLAPGDEIQVAAMFKYLADIASLGSKVEQARNSLSKAVDLLSDGLPDPLKTIKVGPDASEAAKSS